MELFYGQIRPGNYTALEAHYGHEPPWPMHRAPHISLVEAVVAGRDPADTPYGDYIRAGHGQRADETLSRQTDMVKSLLKAPALTADIEHRCVLDGNHRVAVHLVTGTPLKVYEKVPYQTLVFPDHTVTGRRFALESLPYDLRDKTVLDLGCAQGALSVLALRGGAARVTAVDHDLRSTTWQLRDAWGFRERMTVVVDEIDACPVFNVDVVIAHSVVWYVSPERFRALTEGAVVLLETHVAGQPPPDTGHRYEHVGSSAYSREEPMRKRDLLVGYPEG